MCMCGFERGGGTLGGLGDRDREKGDRDRLAGAWLAGWTSEAEREASTAVTAVAIEVAVVACCLMMAQLSSEPSPNFFH